MEVEFVPDYRGVEHLWACDGVKMKRIKIRFPPTATRFCLPVYHSAGKSRCERDSTIDAAREITIRTTRPTVVTRMTRASHPC